MRGSLTALTMVVLLVAAAPASAQLFVAVLPPLRAVQVGAPATAFATVINAGSSTAQACGLAIPIRVPAAFTYQTTDAATNEPTGAPDTPVDIPAGASQSFVFGLTPTVPFELNVLIAVECAETGPAVDVSGLNTLTLVASASPVPDVIAIAVTPTHDGIAKVPGAFAVAAVNVGVAAPCTAPNVFICSCVGSGLEVAAESAVPVTLCATNPSTGECVGGGPRPVITLTSTPGVVRTLSVFMTGTADFAPAVHRVTVTFREYADVMVHANIGCLLDPGRLTRIYKGERGATSVAVAP